MQNVLTAKLPHVGAEKNDEMLKSCAQQTINLLRIDCVRNAYTRAWTAEFLAMADANPAAAAAVEAQATRVKQLKADKADAALVS